MTQKTLGQHTVQIEGVLDEDGSLKHYKVTSESFPERPFRVLSEEEVTLEVVERHIEMLQIFG